MKTYNCLNCGKESRFDTSKTNKFCSNQCQGLFKWVNETRPRIERGECTQTNTLRKYLAETVGEKCSCCGIGTEWQKLPLTLHVDHIDGDSDNNFPSNLRFLCPNCHTQTETYGSKGLGSRYRKSSSRSAYNKAYRDERDGRMV